MSNVGRDERNISHHYACGLVWRPQTTIFHKQGSLSQAYKKNTDANAEVNDINQKTMQALESLAVAHSAFDASHDKVSEGFRQPLEELNVAQQRMRRLRRDSCATVVNASTWTSWICGS